MSENTKPFNNKDFGSMTPEVFSAVRFIETISCQLADVTRFLDDIDTMRQGNFTHYECTAMTEAARVLRRRCHVMKKTLKKLNILKS